MRTMLACALIVATCQVPVASAGMDAMPARIDIAKFTCGDLLGLSADLQERALVYLTGVVDGRRRASVFDAEVAGKAIDRLLTTCRVTPSLVAVDALVAAGP
jgi:hypothetical protein